jgi:hypothetical protein
MRIVLNHAKCEQTFMIPERLLMLQQIVVVVLVLD